MADGKLVSKNVVLSNIFYSTKQHIYTYTHTASHGVWLHWDFFLGAAATRGISFLPYQPSDVTRCHGGQGSPCSGHSWSGKWQWGWGQRSTGFCAVLGKPIRLFALTFAPRKKMHGPPWESQAALRAEPAASFPSFRYSTVSSSWLWTTPVPLLFFSIPAWHGEELDLEDTRLLLSLKQLKMTCRPLNQTSWSVIRQVLYLTSALQDGSQASNHKLQSGLKGWMWLMN